MESASTWNSVASLTSLLKYCSQHCFYLIHLHRCKIVFHAGNSKTDINFLPAPPSLKEKLKRDAKSFKVALNDESNQPPQYQPRNVRQAAYFKSVSSTCAKIGCDEFVTLHELAYMIPGFVWTISTFPDLVVTCGIQFMSDVVQKCSVIMMSYDTTFNLGDFYVSVLVAQLGAFSQHPILPVAFVIHERKFNSVHKDFFAQINQRISPSFQPLLVTDGETSVVKAVKQMLPHWKLVSCWNHILTDVEVWLKKRHVSVQEIAIYKSTVRELLSCQTSDAFATKLATVKTSWSEAFNEYVNKFLVPRMEVACQYHLQSVGATVESVTNNISESFNSVLKRHQDWREVTIDSMVFVLYKLQNVYKTQVLRSMQGFGPYSLDRSSRCGTLL
jgi:hypothetical protein